MENNQSGTPTTSIYLLLLSLFIYLFIFFIFESKKTNELLSTESSSHSVS